jgi:putative hydrolase of the HAD superfamily
MTFNAVCFDVGGVLTMSMESVMPQAAAKAGIDLVALGPVLAEMFISDGDGDNPGHRLERGEISIDEFAELAGAHGASIRALLHPDSEHFIMAALTPSPLMHDFVSEVHDAGLATGVISNVVHEWMPWWVKFTPPAHLFDTILYSCAIGQRKPNSLIYETAITNLAVEPSEILYLDDFAPMADAARKAGMRVIDVGDHASAIAEARRLLAL